MKSAATTFVHAILFCLAALFAAGDACAKVPTMTWVDACHKACDNQPWYDLCPETLRNAPVTAEVTVYALVAARLAKLKYDDTMAAIDQTLADGSLPAGERAGVDYCRVQYGEARGLMASVTDQLFGCDFTRGKQEYLHAKDAVESCKSRIWWSFQGSSRLFTMVSADLDATMVAYDLGALVVGMYGAACVQAAAKSSSSHDREEEERVDAFVFSHV